MEASTPWRISERIRIRSIVGKSAADKPSAPADDDAHRCGIGTALLRVRLFGGTRASQQGRETVIPLVAPRFIVDLIGRVVLLLQLLLDRPRSGPRRRIVDRDGILHRVGVESRPA